MNKIKEIKEIFEIPQSKFYSIEKEKDFFKFGDNKSFMSNDTDLTELTFDISNNRALVNMDTNGTIKKMTIFRDTYRVNEGMNNGSWPGVWLHKDFASFGEYSFKIKVNNNLTDLNLVNWKSKTAYIDDIFPITTFYGDEIIINIICFSPVLNNGASRLDGTIYGCYVENISSEPIECEVILPEQFASRAKREAHIQAEGVFNWDTFRGDDFEIFLLESQDDVLSVKETINPSKGIFIPVAICLPGSDFLDTVNEIGVIDCFNQTWEYFKGITGELQIENDGYFSEFYKRNLLYSLMCLSIDQNGNLSGSNWGTVPSHFLIWIKDMYYSCLPIANCDTALFEKIILWFEKYGVRHRGHMSKGGVTHALSLSVAPIVMSGIYYETTANSDFFKNNPFLISSFEKIIQTMLDERIDKNIYLYSSEFLSDGITYGDWHVGTNICAWKALLSLSEIFEEVYNDTQKSRYYKELAEKTKSDIEKHCNSTTKHGVHYNEGYFADGRMPALICDGEESDTTLMPYYGYCDKINEKYLNYMKFSMSPENIVYNEKLRCIKWSSDPYNFNFPVNATAPGYLKGLALITENSELYDDDNAFQNLRRVMDADGAIWWWPYYYSKYSNYNCPKRGKHSVAKSGWATGIISALFLERFLGIKYIAKTKTLYINPLALKSYTWENFPMGNARFSVWYDGEQLKVHNLNSFEVNIEFANSKSLSLANNIAVIKNNHINKDDIKCYS